MPVEELLHPAAHRQVREEGPLAEVRVVEGVVRLALDPPVLLDGSPLVGVPGGLKMKNMGRARSPLKRRERSAAPPLRNVPGAAFPF